MACHAEAHDGGSGVRAVRRSWNQSVLDGFGSGCGTGGGATGARLRREITGGGWLLLFSSSGSRVVVVYLQYIWLYLGLTKNFEANFINREAVGGPFLAQNTLKQLHSITGQLNT